jgi:hypothetical protein
MSTDEVVAVLLEQVVVRAQAVRLLDVEDQARDGAVHRQLPVLVRGGVRVKRCDGLGAGVAGHSASP